MRKNIAPQRGVSGGLDGAGATVPHGISKNPEADVTLIQPVTRAATAPEEERPDPEKVVSGDPVHTTWNIEEVDGLYCGMWQSTPGAWRVSYAEWEYVHILSGHSVLRGDDGSETHLRAGDSFIIRPGFAGVWEVVETTLKDYVIRA